MKNANSNSIPCVFCALVARDQVWKKKQKERIKKSSENRDNLEYFENPGQDLTFNVDFEGHLHFYIYSTIGSSSYGGYLCLINLKAEVWWFFQVNGEVAEWLSELYGMTPRELIIITDVLPECL